MNNFVKRTVAFVLTVCLLSALVIPAMAFAPAEAETDGSYVYSFQDAMSLSRSNGTTESTFGAQSAAVPETNNTAQGDWNTHYENGNVDWSYPQILGTAGSGKSTEALVLNDTAGMSQFYGGDHLLAKLGTADTVAWFVLKIKAPAVGTYNVSIEHKTGSNNGVKEGKVHILPAFDLGTVDTFDAAAYNAQIDAIVAGGKYVLDGTLDCDNGGNASNLVTEMGSVVLDDVNVQEYFVIFSADLSKSDTTSGVRFYLQELKLTPADVAATSATYSLTTTATGYDKTMSDVVTNYEDGTANWTVAGKHSGVTNFNLNATHLTAGYTMYSAKDPKWVALKLRAPEAGSYELVVNSNTVNGTTDPRTGTPMSAYLIDASTVADDADLAALITEDNLVGSYAFGTGNQSGSYGMVDISAEEYILILKAEASDPLLWSGEGALHANNFYLASIELNGFAAAIGEEKYTTVADACAAAQEDDDIILLVDYVGNIDLPAGVSLDLNGNDWTVSEYVATNVSEYVYDSAAEGVWTVGSMTLYSNNGGYTPLYDEAAGGYRLYKMGITVESDDYEVVGEATRFWFKVEFVQADAFALLKSGKCGLTFGADLAWGSETLDVTFDNGEGAEAFTAAWATAAETSSTVWLYVDVKGLDSLTEDLTVTPTVKIAGNDLSAGSLLYTVA